MFYLEKCELCGKHGFVAVKEDDSICKLCKEVEETNEDEEVEEEE